jgi:hypothetical protein
MHFVHVFPKNNPEIALEDWKLFPCGAYELAGFARKSFQIFEENCDAKGDGSPAAAGLLPGLGRKAERQLP